MVCCSSSSSSGKDACLSRFMRPRDGSPQYMYLVGCDVARRTVARLRWIVEIAVISLVKGCRWWEGSVRGALRVGKRSSPRLRCGGHHTMAGQEEDIIGINNAS